MRTDTATFRANAFKAIRAHGVSSRKAKIVTERLIGHVRQLGFPQVLNGSKILVSMDDERAQSVAIVHQGLVLAGISGRQIPDAVQPLVNCTPTARQVEIGEILSDMMSDLYGAIGDGAMAYENLFGHPSDDAGWEASRAFVRAFPAVAEINGRYDALKAESLAINPNVAAMLVDPDKASHWYEWHHDLYHYRPTGFMTLAMVEAAMERMKGIPIDAYDMAA